MYKGDTVDILIKLKKGEEQKKKPLFLFCQEGTYHFSYPPPFDYLKKLKIPVLVTYGTKDYRLVQSADYFRMEMIRQKKENFTFKAYTGTEHNFFPLKANGEINYDIFNWEKVADDWRNWLMKL